VDADAPEEGPGDRGGDPAHGVVFGQPHAAILKAGGRGNPRRHRLLTDESMIHSMRHLAVFPHQRRFWVETATAHAPAEAVPSRASGAEDHPAFRAVPGLGGHGASALGEEAA
jgi:hypothetical protein